jgi:hypothetical protein
MRAILRRVRAVRAVREEQGREAITQEDEDEGEEVPHDGHARLPDNDERHLQQDLELLFDRVLAALVEPLRTIPSLPAK